MSNQQFENAFQWLTKAKELDSQNDRTCIAYYKEACKLFRNIIHHESDASKKKLIEQQVFTYEGRISELDGVLDCFEDVFDQPPASTATPIIVVPVKDNAAELRKLEKDADDSFATALAQDEKMEAEITSQNTDNVAKMKKTCIELYLSTADKYMKVLKLNSNSNIQITNRLNNILDRANDLKKNKIASYSSIDTINDALLDLPDIPTLSVATSTVAPVPNVPISGMPGHGGHAANIPNTGRATGASALSDKELLILKQSSMINGLMFLPWLDKEEEREVFRTFNDKPFVDPDGLLKLSDTQIKAGQFL